MPDRVPWWLPVTGGVFVLLAGILVTDSLRRPSPSMYGPLAPGASPVVDSLPGLRVTLDARDPERWAYYDFSARRVREVGNGGDWDLAARRYHVMVNGGEALPGDAAVAPAGEASLDGPHRVPRAGWTGTRRDGDGELVHPLLADWYRYDFVSHLLLARPQAYVLRTVEGRYVKLRFESYYCPGTEAGCVTFRYVELPPARRASGGTGAAGGRVGGP